MAWPTIYEAMSSELNRHKVVFLGPQGAGKTSIVVRFMYNTFEPDYMGTIGIDFMSHVVSVEGTQVRLQIWDTAGQERFRALVPTYIRGAKAVFMAFDVTREPGDIEAELKRWFNMVALEGDSPVIILMANKVDRDDIRKIDTSVGRSWAEEFGASYFETSAKTGHNITEAFKGAAKQLLTSPKEGENEECIHNVTLRPEEESRTKESSCICSS